MSSTAVRLSEDIVRTAGVMMRQTIRLHYLLMARTKIFIGI